MDLEKVRKLVDLVVERGLTELEIDTEELSIRICRGGPVLAAPQVAGAPGPTAATAAPPPAAAATAATANPAWREVKSPIVGTFYRAPEPNSPPFVEVGQRVSPGDTLCIVEAMKVMNEIEAEFACIVREICRDDAQPVEAEAVLFRVEPA
ncbi:MAG TPA: acetyl-CoA carboxylase biotin carboxyl carrier protein [Candidatus Krumholzibacteria bacterium]|nr:acetyl-CoA carboxylase biotin carboxyl carrier protein [Candidatus Krumholzibacteria bacterium]HPD71716.1 acetyl-CoA carboxylase biotin carboxyl carrier protein [Candidatus Krumholzibacteria bacterium]HRY41351.1 acetyl-CoA carboxylase biotin carboxyl carrier protein [Candidatus Krumholzibacteria bacterium]